MCCILLPGSTYALNRKNISREDQIKAAFLLKFINFIEREDIPDQPDQSHRICVIGKNQFGEVLERLIEIQMNDRHLPKVDFRHHEDPSHTDACTVLFLSRSEGPRLQPILDIVSSKGILTVSDIDGFAHKGGMIELIREGNNVRFIINNGIAKMAGIKISAQLLSLAKEILEDPHAT